MPEFFGVRLKRMRNLRGYTMEELGEKVGVAKTTISGYEQGNREPPIKVIYQLARALNTTSDYLLGLTDTDQMQNPSRGPRI
jgi:transcriptional regulator with XRE-family HTH domain